MGGKEGVGVAATDSVVRAKLVATVLGYRGMSIISSMESTLVEGGGAAKAFGRSSEAWPDAVKGMASIYRRWQDESAVFTYVLKHASFHYLAHAPSPHHSLGVADWLVDEGKVGGAFPKGSITPLPYTPPLLGQRGAGAGGRGGGGDATAILAAARRNNSSPESMDPAARSKYDAIVALMTSATPGRKFVIVGDSAGSDPEIFGAVARTYVGRSDRRWRLVHWEGVYVGRKGP